MHILTMRITTCNMHCTFMHYADCHFNMKHNTSKKNILELRSYHFVDGLQSRISFDTWLSN